MTWERSKSKSVNPGKKINVEEKTTRTPQFFQNPKTYFKRKHHEANIFGDTGNGNETTLDGSCGLKEVVHGKMFTWDI